MKRKREESSGSRTDSVPDDLKRTRLDAKFEIKPHRKKLQVQSSDKDTSQSKLDSLPLDLKLAILTRMPAKSLMNLRCVSKMWYSIIRSPEFVRSFFSVSSTRPKFLVALSNGIYNKEEERLVFLFSFESSSSSPNLDMVLGSTNFSHFSGLCTSLHGLLSVKPDGRFRICNPCTEQVITLPELTRYVGYDPTEDQYKAFTYFRCERRDRMVYKVLTLGKDREWRRVEPPTTSAYTPSYIGLSINGFVYYAAYSPRWPTNPCIVCFDVRAEKLSYIKAPLDVVYHGTEGTFIEFKGKLASIVRNLHNRFHSFDLWVLEDVEKHEWSKQTCVLPLSVWDFVCGSSLSFSGINHAGEIIIAPRKLWYPAVRPFYIFYYNVETQNIRRVRLLGIGDNEEFMRSYGFLGKGECHVRIVPQHIESINFFKNSITLPKIL